MWIDKDGFAHVEDQYDPSTFAENNKGKVDWKETKKWREKHEIKFENHYIIQEHSYDR